MFKHSSNLGVGVCLTDLTPISPTTLYSPIFIDYLHESLPNWSNGCPRPKVERWSQMLDVKGKTSRPTQEDGSRSPSLDPISESSSHMNHRFRNSSPGLEPPKKLHARSSIPAAHPSTTSYLKLAPDHKENVKSNGAECIQATALKTRWQISSLQSKVFLSKRWFRVFI